jgi:DNA (cytosine-5)-methyltransferase 1
MRKLSVIDFFCGAGGFSEGFRQQGFEIKMGIDSWQPAIETFNHNFGLNCSVKNILDFENSTEEIESLPDTDVIIGSPPCVSFSHSNISGKADKESGILLTRIFLRIVAVKKFKKNSLLKAWFMENVSNSKNYLSDYYTFKDLGLSAWAKKNRLSPNKKAIILKDNQPIINSADYGSPQKRKRVVSGEIISKNVLIIPAHSHKNPLIKGPQEDYRTLKFLKSRLPKPNTSKSRRMIQDPLYPTIKIKASELSDHYYDTGLYSCEWRQSKYLKINHPYMGIMSFPENVNNPSRTITATKIGTSRESIIYNSEFNRKGDGEFRTPTVREAACLMGFPITFQFKGSEGTKWRLVGNAVCPSVSRAFAKQLRAELGYKKINAPLVKTSVDLKGINNLNNYSVKEFAVQPKRNKNSRFRRHPFKDGNMTVTLSNYNIEQNGKDVNKWITSVQYGNGEGFRTFNFPDNTHKKLGSIIRNFKKGDKFIKLVNSGFSERIAKGEELQKMYEMQHSVDDFLEPTELIEELASVIERLKINGEQFVQNGSVIFKQKEAVPVKQLFALYAINKVAYIANK